MTRRPLRPAGAALVAVLALLTTLLVATPAQAAGVVPAVTSPLPLDAVKGIWTVSATASTDTGDPFTSVSLLLDGVDLGVADLCAGSDQPCSLSTEHDFSGLTGTHTVSVVAVTAATGPGGVTDAVTFTVTSPGPTASITSPADGSTRKGVFDVTFSGQTDASQTGELVGTIQLLRGPSLGSAVLVSTKDCGGTSRTCTSTVAFDATALPDGALTLWARTTSTAAVPRQATDSITLSISNPAPAVQITSPASGASVNGVVTVSVSGSTDAALNDAPSTLQLLLDGVAKQSFGCGPGTTCAHGFSIDLTQVADGAHTLGALLTTTGGKSASDSVGVTVASPAPSVSISAPAQDAQLVGHAAVQVSASTGSRLTDYPSAISVAADSVVIGSVTCAGAGTRACSGSVDWDTTGLTGTHTLTATVTTTNGVQRTSSTRTITVDTPVPAVAISDPVGGATVSGTVVVTADATTDTRLTELPSQVQLLVDGTIVDTQQCTSGTHDCPITLTWDATGITGDHVLTTVVTTSLLRTATSDPVAVAVTTPPFDVAITSPAASSVVVGAGATATSSGTVAVSVSASTDLGQNEFPQTVELLVDGVPVDSSPCQGNPEHTCTAILHWDASSSAGLHRLAARLTTNRSHEATSASRSVFALSGSRVAFFAPPSAAYGGYTIVRGRVASTTSKQPLVGAAVRLVLVPAVGKARTVVVRTGVGGVFTIRTRYFANTVVSARVGASWLVKGTAVATQRVRAPITCSTARTTTLSGARGTGVCVVKSLPAGTVVRLRYLYRGRWATLANGRTTSTVIRFTYAFRPRGTYSLQVTVGTSRVYVATASRLMKVVIR